jgi:hypothetical protein
VSVADRADGSRSADPGSAPLGDESTDGRGGSGRSRLDRVRAVLAPLFPQAPQTPRSRRAVVVGRLADIVAIALGAWILLERQIGVPAWNSIWAEDHKIFLPDALLHPWSTLFKPYDGYLELLPRLIGEGVARLPFSDAALAFALAGATIASGCAVFVFHACSGHVRTPALRVVLALSVLLLPTAIIEIANSGVNSPWYLLFTVFWALLWRPKSRVGMAAAALICFAAASSNALTALYLPLVAARVIVLPRLREQAAAIGWLVGGALQVPVVLSLTRHHQPASLTGALGFYGRIVILPVVAGHHLALQLWADVGLTGAMIFAGLIIAVALAWGCLRCGAEARALVIAAVVLGILLTFIPLFVHGSVTTRGFSRHGLYVRGSRYGQAPILLLDSALIVAVDHYLRRGGVGVVRVAQVVAAVVLVAVLGTSWVSDYRYVNKRSTLTPWSRTVARVERRCQQDPQRPVPVRPIYLPCSKVRG